jgi:Methyltransferase domain
VQNDLKDLQRPWTMKATLGLLPPRARLLEIGAGQPLVAAYLAQLGYELTVVDPYDGSGGGPREFEIFTQAYPQVRIIRARFQCGLPELAGESFDGIYSISVLEHVPEPDLGSTFKAIAAHLRSHGQSFHCADCVTQGDGVDSHAEQCFRIFNYQAELARKTPAAREEFNQVLVSAERDLETCYLSAVGHNLWRGGKEYRTFPFRKVISVQYATRFEKV